MTAPDRRPRRSRADDRHLDRLYLRIDDLDKRMTRIERVVWSIGTAAIMTAGTAIYNLAHSIGGS